MRIPKYIEQAMQRRANAAKSFFKNDKIITKFIEENNLVIDPSLYNGGADAMFCPEESIEQLKEDIKKQ